MADDATRHVGWSLGARVDFSQIERMNRMVDVLGGRLEKVDNRFSSLKMPANLPNSIRHADDLTASYVRRLESAGKSYEANQEKVKLYSHQISMLKDHEQGLESELSKVAEKQGTDSEAYEKTKVKINETETAINQYKNGLKASQAEMDKLHPTGFNRITRDAGRVVKASDAVRNKLHKAWDSIKGGATVAAAGIGAVGAAAISGAKKAGALQQSYREINNLAVLGGEKQRAVTKSIAKMQRQGRDISIKYGKSQQDIANGFEDLVKRGYSTRQALGALKTEVQASVASGDDFKDVTTVSSQVLESFGMRANSTAKMVRNTKRAVNELAYSADATSTGFHSLGDSVHYFGAAAKAQHISLAESASAVGVLSNNGIEGSMGGTAMRDIINRIGNQINLIGKSNSIFDQLGIRKKEMEDSKGHLKSLADAMDVIWAHIKKHSDSSIQQQGFMKSIFGTTAQNAATILAKNTGQLRTLTKHTAEMGSKGNYVAQLAAKNSQTAQMQVARAHQAMNAFTIEIGAKLLPAINEAGNDLAKFLTTKDGKIFERDTAGAVKNFADTLINLIRWGTTHTTTLKLLGGGFVLGYGGVKLAQFVSFLGDVDKAYGHLADKSPKIKALGDNTKSLFNPHTRFRDLSKTAKLTATVSVAFDAAQIGTAFYQALKSKNINTKYAKYGQGIGGLVGGAIGYSLGGFAGAQIGTQLGLAMGPSAAKSFGKAFSGHATKYMVYGRKGASSNGKYGSIAERYNEERYYTTTDRRIKGHPALYAYDANGYYDLKTHKYHDQRSLAERSWGMNHRMDYRSLAHPNNAWDVLAGGANVAWNAVGHIGDKNFWKRSQPGWNAAVKGSWLDWSGFAKGFSSMFGGQKVKAAEITKAERNGKTIGRHAVKGAKSGMSGFPNWTDKLGDKSNKFFKSRWSGMESWANKVHSNTRRGWNGFEKWSGAKSRQANRFFKSEWSGMKSWASGINSNIRSGWGGITKWFGTLGHNMVRGLKTPFEGLSDWFNQHVQKPIGKISGNVDKFFHGKLKIGNLHLASGTNWRSKYGIPAILNDGNDSPKTNNRESIIHANGQWELLPNKRNLKRRILPGEDVVNAKDTAKIASGLITNHFASGTVRLGKTTKTVTSNYKKITDDSTKQLNRLTKNNKSAFTKINSSATKQTSSLQRKNNSVWGKITSQTNKQTDKTRKDSISDFTNMRKGVGKQMDNMHDSVISTAQSTTKGFGKAIGRMDNYAHSAMSNTMKQLNQGIKGIDKVLSQFGGNGDVIKTVHFATGSDSTGRLTHTTMAMVNDAGMGPRQEALITDHNDLVIPHGSNRRMVIPKGWGVLNGYQTQSLAHSMGLQHFAKGSGVGHSELRKIASRGQSDPSKSFSDNFTSHVQAHSPQLEKGTTGLGKNASTHFGVPWMAAMWNVINDAIGGASGKGGTREAFLKYAESTFSGVPYQMGAASKRLSDCSGMVMQALRHFGINIGRTTVAMQHSSGTEYLGKSLSKTLPGDLVIFGHGTGAAGHVGIIKNPHTGSMFNETPPRARVTSIADDKGMGYGYYRVRGLHNASTKSEKVTADKRLEALAKQELGKTAISWIKKNLSDDLGSLGSFALGGDIGDRAKVLARALKKLDPRATKNGIAAILGNWEFESGLNPGAINPGGGASGLGQWLGGRKSNLIAYAKRHGMSWKNAGAQLSFAVKGDTGNTGILRHILEGHGSVASLANAFSSEWERGGYNAEHVHGAMEVRKALGYAKGGTHHGSGSFLVGEQGPEIMSVGQDAKIDSYPTTKRKLTSLSKLFKPITTKMPKISAGSIKKSPTINININGPISSSHEAKVVADMIQQKIVETFEHLGDDLGTDDSVY